MCKRCNEISKDFFGGEVRWEFIHKHQHLKDCKKHILFESTCKTCRKE